MIYYLNIEVNPCLNKYLSNLKLKIVYFDLKVNLNTQPMILFFGNVRKFQYIYL